MYAHLAPTIKNLVCTIATIPIMATISNDVKQDMASVDAQKIEHLSDAEKSSHVSKEIEAQQIELDEKEAARVLRKVDMRLVPMLSLLYLVAFIDRSNSKCCHCVCIVAIMSLTSLQSVMPKLRA